MRHCITTSKYFSPTMTQRVNLFKLRYRVDFIFLPLVYIGRWTIFETWWITCNCRIFQIVSLQLVSMFTCQYEFTSSKNSFSCHCCSQQEVYVQISHFYSNSTRTVHWLVYQNVKISKFYFFWLFLSLIPNVNPLKFKVVLCFFSIIWFIWLLIQHLILSISLSNDLHQWRDLISQLRWTDIPLCSLPWNVCSAIHSDENFRLGNMCTDCTK